LVLVPPAQSPARVSGRTFSLSLTSAAQRLFERFGFRRTMIEMTCELV
jgi:hypothetical protein